MTSNTTPFAGDVLVRPRGTDTWGDRGTSTTRTISGAVWWPRTSTETAEYSESVATGYMLSIPTEEQLASTDEVLLPGEREDGEWWRVEGDPLGWGPSPFTGWTPGTIVALTRNRG